MARLDNDRLPPLEPPRRDPRLRESSSIEDTRAQRLLARPHVANTVTPDAINIQVDHLEIVGTPEDRFALGETIYNLPLRIRGIIMAVIAALGFISAFALSGPFSNPDTYAGIIQTLDAKESNVLALTAAATSASTAISIIPDDAGSAIADKLADLTVGFLVILVAIFLEKYLLTVIGFLLFAVVIPVCCGLYIASLALREYRVTRTAFSHFATRLLCVGIAFFALVPTSVGLSNMIDATYQESIDQAIALAEQSGQQVEEIVEEQPEEAPQTDQEGEGEGDLMSWFADRWADIQNAAGEVADTVTGAVTGLTSWFQGILNNFIEITAVMLVTSCIIPILVLIVFLFIVKAIFNVDISKPMAMLDPRTYRKARTVANPSNDYRSR